MAHYHMGGIRVDVNMQTRVEGLYAAGEAVGGANGANRLSGNAITEAFVFGARAGAAAAESVKGARSEWNDSLTDEALRRLKSFGRDSETNGVAPIALQAELQKLMWEQAGPFRTGAKLSDALARIDEMRKKDLPRLQIGAAPQFNLDLHDAFELRAMLATAEAVVRSALARTESRGAHQREDFPAPDDTFLKNQILELKDGEIESRWLAPVRVARGSANDG
jgi:succinate dehydrogenase/fumarate reductase flavoprotein subunit